VTYLDDNTGVLGGKTVPEGALDKQADGLQMSKNLICLGEVYSRQLEQFRLLASAMSALPKETAYP
jgi:hypothetical protein